MRRETGTVVEFDARRGLGTVRAADGARLRFHCTQLDDDARAVEAGVEVRYAVAPGALGSWEAVAVAVT